MLLELVAMAGAGHTARSRSSTTSRCARCWRRLTALLIGLVFGPAVIRKLTAMKIGQAVRNDGPQTHLIKTGTPTMGGALILISIGLATLLWADLANRFVWLVLIVTLGLRRDRLGRRLPQGRASQSEGHVARRRSTSGSR